MGEFIVNFLNSSNAWFYTAKDGQVSLYWNDADGQRHVARKVKNFDKETMKHTSEWVNFGLAPKSESANEVPSSLVDALKALVANND